MSSDEYLYECKICSWIGNEQQVEYEYIEGCFGDDKIEICPVCGNQSITIRHMK